jgi:hypothetical protein
MEIPEFQDEIDHEVVESRSNTSEERIKHKNWKVRKDIYDEVITNIENFKIEGKLSELGLFLLKAIIK